MHTSLPRLSPGPSLYDVVRADLDPEGRLRTARLRLPDAPEPVPGELRWAEGALDGVSHHLGHRTDDVQAALAESALTAALTSPTRESLGELDRLLREEGALGYVEPLVERVLATRPDPGTVHDVALWLATTSDHRDPVKIGLRLLGLTGTDAAVDVVLALGAHEELTRYAAAALLHGSTTPEDDLWRLARRVDGWGRIECIDRLAGTTDTRIRDWLLRGGYRNTVLDEYTAYTAATTGDLRGALRRDDVDRELLTSAGLIIDSLVRGGPAQDLDDLDDAPALLDAYLDQLADRAENLVDLQAAASVLSLLLGEHGDAVSEAPWTEPDRARVAGKADQVVSRGGWQEVIRSGLASGDGAEFWRANGLAPRFGIDTFDLHLDRVRADPLGSAWYNAWRVADSESRRDVLVGLAHDLFLPIDAAGVPTVRPGTDFTGRTAVDWTLQELRPHPGLGADLVPLGLTAGSNPNMALRVLEAWPVVAWPAGVTDVLRDLVGSVPENEERVAALLRRATDP